MNHALAIYFGGAIGYMFGSGIGIMLFRQRFYKNNLRAKLIETAVDAAVWPLAIPYRLYECVQKD
jgi:hypothetical protein